MYGKGLVNAHIQCDQQNWAGTTVEPMLSQFIEERGLIHLLDRVAIKTMVPYKVVVEDQQEEYALRLVSATLNDVAFGNLERDIRRVFADDHKGMNDRSREMLENRLPFAALFKEVL